MQRFSLFLIAGLFSACGSAGKRDARASETPRTEPTPVVTVAPNLNGGTSAAGPGEVRFLNLKNNLAETSMNSQ